MRHSTALRSFATGLHSILGTSLLPGCNRSYTEKKAALYVIGLCMVTAAEGARQCQVSPGMQQILH